jgi:Polyketide cyclase / dehydrase and lipid transport
LPASAGTVHDVGRYTYTIEVDAPPELVHELWTDLDLMKTWVGGVTKVSPPSGPMDRVGTRYTVYFGKARSETEIVEVDPPRLYMTRFGNAYLRGTNRTEIVPVDASGQRARITQTFETEGFLPGIVGWIFGHGSYRGSFLGELRHFGRIAAAEATQRRGVA